MGVEMMKKEKYNYSLSHIRALRSVVTLRRMWVPDYFKQTSSLRMRRAYNGIGPERWSSRFRKFFTRVLDRIEAAALIHDVEWSRRQKSFRLFLASNVRLTVNATKECGLYVGLAAGILCTLFGYGGYKKT